jgi:beta-glucosidase
LRDLLRRRWGFEGVIVSDHGAVAELIVHGVAADLAEAAALALRAGVDQDMMGRAYERGLPAALERGLVTEAEVEAAVRRVLRWKARLGLFDDPCRGLAGGPAAWGRGTDRALAREVAVRSLVLLQNRGELLPLADAARRIAVIGPLAAAGGELLGPWSAAGDRGLAVSYLDGLRAGLPGREIRHAAGCAVQGGDVSGFAEALALARQADLVVLCLGESAALAGEAASRGDPGLPGLQRALAEALLATGAPLLLVLTAGRPLIEPAILARAPAAIAAWFPGQEGGTALADLVTGRCAPAGRLAVSWPADRGQIPVFFGQRPTGRAPGGGEERYVSRYLDLPNAPLYPFGHGLTYTRFRCRGLTAAPGALAADAVLTVELELANEGERAAEETILLFLHDPGASSARPLLELRGFQRVALGPGERRLVRFALPPEAFLLPGPDLEPVREAGRIEVLVGPTADRSCLLSTWIELLPA